MAKNRKTPDMNLPVWFDGQNINEALFCEEFLQERRIIFTNRAFFTPNGRVTDDIVLRGEVYEKLKNYTISSVPQKIKNIMELLKLEAMVDDFPPQPDRIHVANGTLMLDGRFIEGKKEIVQSRLPVSYNPNAAAPALWLNFLDGLLYEEDIPILQEFIGYCLIPSNKREKVNNPDHAHILSGILKCPCCGKSMYGNIAKAHSKDKKTRYYYYCKNTVTPTGHECSFRLNIEQTEINKFVAKIISAMVNNPRFVEAIQAKIGSAVDTEDMEKQIAVLQGQLKQTYGTKSRLERQMDTLDINDAHYDRKILDLQRRYDEQYDTIEEIEVQIGELQSQIRSIQQEKISGDNIYRLLLAFDEVYHSATEAEQKEFMKAFIERIEMFPEKRKDGSWIKKIVFNFPVPVDGEEVKELPLETETTVENVVVLTRK